MFCCLVAQAGDTPTAQGVVEAIARACSPRVALHGQDAVIFDVTGLGRACGPPEVIAREVARMVAERGLTARVAIADTRTTAWILAHVRSGITVACGAGKAALADLPTTWLATVFDLDRIVETLHQQPEPTAGPPRSRVRRGRAQNYRVAPPPAAVHGAATKERSTARASDRAERALCVDRLGTFERWGIRTCGDVAALRRADIHARMGSIGVRLHQAAHGEDVVPLVPVDEAPVFADRVQLDWPIDGLEPLAFVLARQCERLSKQLERADRGAVGVYTALTLVTRERHERQLALPAPLRDARVLRTLIGLDLESNPPNAAIDAVEIRLDVTPGRILQGSLLAWAVPTPEDLSTLLARLGALVGELRVGAPVCPDTHDLRQVATAPFVVRDRVFASGHREPSGDRVSSSHPETRFLLPLRRFRLPIAARVTVEHGVPKDVWPSARNLVGGRVVTCAGPWRSSGLWWTPAFGDFSRTDSRADRGTAWDRDEWDVEVADGVVYRLARQRQAGGWEIEGVFD
jgi:protein ImuB